MSRRKGGEKGNKVTNPGRKLGRRWQQILALKRVRQRCAGVVDVSMQHLAASLAGSPWAHLLTASYSPPHRPPAPPALQPYAPAASRCGPAFPPPVSFRPPCTLPTASARSLLCSACCARQPTTNTCAA